VAEKKTLDVWIVESNTVYKQVPFTVVIDWVQQGRLLENDRVRVAGGKTWKRIGDSPTFTPYLPQTEPDRPEDEAEALEPVELDFHIAKKHEAEDDDVDMIPLIDVSLVLIVFFMMTTAGAATSAFIETPGTLNGTIVNNPKALRVDINKGADKDTPIYAVGLGDVPATKENSDLTEAQALDHLRELAARASDKPELIINAHKDLPARHARQFLLGVHERPELRDKLTLNFFGVRDKAP
jgi:biopolymer transport protein ExbD